MTTLAERFGEIRIRRAAVEIRGDGATDTGREC